VVDEDIILFWGTDRRIITGSDILGRLLRGIAENESVPFEKHAREQ
jgi:metal transporter CNNM